MQYETKSNDNWKQVTTDFTPLPAAKTGLWIQCSQGQELKLWSLKSQQDKN